MIVEIRDRDALADIPIASMRAYLNSREWKDVGRWGERAITIFAKEHDGQTFEVLVPHRDSIGGYAENMANAVSVIAKVEDRSQLDVYYELKGAGADVIHIRSTNGKAERPLSISESAGMLNDAKTMLEASARAAEKPKACYRGKLTSEVAEYLGTVKPLPNYSSGYELTMHSPVRMGLGEQLDMDGNLPVPFARRVTKKLATALGNTTEVVAHANTTGTAEPLEDSVASGVSANLCDSIAQLAKHAGDVTIELQWAVTRPSGVKDSYFMISSASAEILSEVSTSLRLRAPSFDECIEGMVVQLDREPEEFDGNAMIATVFDERMVRMKVEFPSDLFGDVIRAFEEKISVSLEGDVHRTGTVIELRNPRNFGLLTPV